MTTRVVGTTMFQGKLRPISETIYGNDEPNPYLDYQPGTFDVKRSVSILHSFRSGNHPDFIFLEIYNRKDRAKVFLRREIISNRPIPDVYISIDDEPQEIPKEFEGIEIREKQTLKAWIGDEKERDNFGNVEVTWSYPSIERR